jgi:hypothetical protein
MTKKLLVVAMALASSLFTANVFGQCGTGATLQFVGVGSSAQFNTMAYAAQDVLTAAGNGFNLISQKNGATISDTRPQYLSPAQPVANDTANIWIAYDNLATCNVYAYFSVDSGVGVKDFMSYVKLTSGFGLNKSVAAAYPSSFATYSGANANQVNGLSDTVATYPANVVTALTLNPVTYIQSAANKKPLAYCGQPTGLTNDGVYCSFNAALTDIRPEDALYAATRALSSYNTTNSLAGLGYNDTNCGANTVKPALYGCPIFDAFGQKKEFNVLSFKLSGTDPIASGSVPAFTTISDGIAPVVVIVNNGTDFGQTYTDAAGLTNYKWNDINHKTLSLVFDGTSHCTGDIINYSNLVSGSTSTGHPLQVVFREPLSGTYNTFEFTGVRTLSGSASSAVGISHVSSTAWVTDDASGQEFSIDPALNPGCYNSSTGVTTVPCGDATAVYSPVPTSSTATGTCGAGLRLRAIGTGEEVAATVATYNTTTSTFPTPYSIDNGIGYAFWSYGNLKPLCSAITQQTSGLATCTGTNLGHYLTVDGIDPLFATEGGEFDPGNVNILINGTPTPVPATNPSGPYNAPLCKFNFAGVSGVTTTYSCFPIPFTHEYDGKYPLWTFLRIMTFSNATNGSLITPVPVLNMIAYAENEANATASRATSDFAPFLTNLVNSGTLTAPSWTGDLNLFVFRSHFKNTNSPNNGHSGCPAGYNFNGVALVGGTSGHATCLIDAGGDVGGSVLTVQQDVDFISGDGAAIKAEYGLSSFPAEIYSLHQ